ncbi:MAG: cytochrome c biogenesis protein CcdA [Betaproteobacteria bacterium]|nr:cytochrome c biogenesis protein CcdA [Betaproteobacteria bacterium]MBI2959714.1 cytochrome c biogenesis protein CcdA [Betaproteobacteria bacterium]
MSDVSAIALMTAFGAGIISFLSPCVLPLVPGYISYVAGDNLAHAHRADEEAQRLHALGLSLCFVAGFSTVFIALGAGATWLGQLLLSYKNEANIAGGILVIVFGLFMVGALRPAWMQRDLRFHGYIKGARPLGAYLIGLAFAFGWTPCIGPVLGAILTVSAVAATVASGVALLGAYSLGLGIPFLATAMFTGKLLKRLKSMRRVGNWLQVGAGVVMILMGLAMITGMLSKFSWWLLNTFPVFATVG